MATLTALNAFAQKDPYVGFYKGEITTWQAVKPPYPLNMTPEIYAEVYREADVYRLRFLSAIFSRSEVHAEASGLKLEGDKILLKEVGPNKITGTIDSNGIQVEFIHREMPIKIAMKKYDFVSPTMGAVAPAGSTVLFDGKDTSKWVLSKNGEACNWQIVDGAMVVRTDAKTAEGKKLNTTIITKDSFRAMYLHLEFKIPAEYDLLAQRRGNSGVFIGDYEIQVLDSFGANGTWGDCGSIYRMYPPQVVACLEPEAWQTYDIEFTPATFHNGKLATHPVLSVWLNGVKVQNNSVVFHSTSLGPLQAVNYVHPQTPLKISLQDHSNSVAYRNIWVETR